MAQVKIDEDFRALIPPLAREELAQLEANIVAEGCRDPLVCWNDGKSRVLIDGHNRHAICERHGVSFDLIDTDVVHNRQEAMLWIIDNQFGRRNLADIDRIGLARRKEAILRPMAKANKGTRTDLRAKLPAGDLSANTDHPSRKESAKLAGVGERTYDAGKAILDAAAAGEIPAEVVEKVRRGEAAIHRVAKDLKNSRAKAKRQNARAEAASKTEGRKSDSLIVGDFREYFDKVQDGSLSLIFTDPPYDRKAIPLFEGLAEFAAAKLADGGSLMCYVGHVQLAAAIEALSKRLRFWWTVCCLHSGGSSLMREYGIRAGWKPVLWFVKGSRHDVEDIVSDVMSGGREKSHHDWQQSLDEASYWIGHLCPEDGIVCDPFLGGGTTAVAAQRLKRQWVAFEKDEAQAAIATERISSDAAIQ